MLLMHEIIGAGYIVIDNEHVIHGGGVTIDAAWADAERTFASGTQRSELHTVPASAKLLTEFAQHGGEIGWVRSPDGVACTPSETSE